MKRLLILLSLVAALTGVALFLHFQRGSGFMGPGQSGSASREFVFPDLPVNDVERVVLRSVEHEVTLVRGEERWQVAERDGYPASVDRVRQLVLDVEALKVSGRQQVGATALAETGLLRPGETSNEEDTGLEVQLFAESGPLADFVLGAIVRTSGSDRSPMSPGISQRLLRTATDGDTAWLVSNTFAGADADPAEWLDRSFFSVSNPKSIEVTHPDAEDSWRAWREEQDAEFIHLGDEGDTVSEDRRSSLRFLLTSPGFLDVIAPDAAEPDLMQGSSRAVIETFDGFTYKIDFVERKPEDGAGEDSGSKWYLMLDIQASFPEERQERLEEEDEEFARVADEVFELQQQGLREKLEAEQMLNGWIFEVSEFTLATLNRKREEMLGDPMEEEAVEPEVGEIMPPEEELSEVERVLEQLRREVGESDPTEPENGAAPESAEPQASEPEPDATEPAEEPTEPTEAEPLEEAGVEQEPEAEDPPAEEESQA